MLSRARTFGGVALVLLLVTAARCGSPASPTPPPSACTYTFLSGTSLSFAATGGTGTVSISASSGCSWTATAEHGWVTFPNGSTASGNTSVTFAVAENTAAAVRETNVTIEPGVGTNRFVVRIVQQGRAAACDYTAATTSQRFSAAGGKGTINVGAAAGCPWQATSSESWLTFEGSTEGNGSGTVTYVVAPWTGTTERSAIVRVGGREVTIRQDPVAPVNCDYSVSPTALRLHWHETNRDIQVSTGEGCTWTVEPGAGWLSIAGAHNRSGPGGVTLTTEQYTSEATRSAPVMIRWPSASQGQNVWITHEGCRYAFSETTTAFTAAGGTGRVTVFRDPVSTDCAIGCPVNPQINGDWIEVTSVTLGLVSDLTMSYRVSALPASVTSRSGSITVGNKVLTITQTR